MPPTKHLFILLAAGAGRGAAWSLFGGYGTTPEPDAEEVEVARVPDLSDGLTVELALARGGALVATEPGPIPETPFRLLAEAAAKSFKEKNLDRWPAFVEATGDEPAAFVFGGDSGLWDPSAPKHVVAAARAARTRLAAARDGVAAALRTLPATRGAGALLDAAEGYPEVHVAFHPAGGVAPMACHVSPGEGDRDVENVAFAAVAAVAVGGGLVEARARGSRDGAWAAAYVGAGDALVTAGGPWAVHTNGRLQAATHRLHARADADVVSLALLAPAPPGAAPDAAAATAAQWRSTHENYRVSALQRYATEPAPASDHPACRDLEARALQVRARLNGDMGSALVGRPVRPCDFADFDAFVEASCDGAKTQTIGRNDLAGDSTGGALVAAEHSDCVPTHGARAYDARGERLLSLEDVLAKAREGGGVVGWPAEVAGDATATWDPNAAADVWLVPSAVHFVWPTVRTGHVTRTSLEDAATGADAGHSSVITTLSMRPQVFRISKFLLEPETSALIERNKPRIRPSEVGLVGRAGDKTRTSTNAWDTASPVARDVIGRAFRLLKIDAHRKLEDGLQVLHYSPTQWYKPHVDYFTQRNAGGGSVEDDAFSNAVPSANNGTNRFATVFLYLNDAAEGGETVFPHSTTHATYRGGYLTHAGTNRTPGFIRDTDAAWVCNASSEALRVVPRTGDSVLFYSQRGDASLDGYSLHGSCPMVAGEKWAANLWVWNRPRDSIDRAKARARSGLAVSFRNAGGRGVDLFWDDGGGVDLVLQGSIAPGRAVDINTFPNHKFVAKVGGAKGTPVGEWTMEKGITSIKIAS